MDLTGFKSFPDKTRLVFTEPVTVIVGPNGSGKSNIADAILWVTGEQSAKTLRGSKMEDVIFGGTKTRHQMGYAEVTLTLDNTDGEIASMPSEIEITRRYYRSGDSEYYISRKQARLRDVTELLMDTGLGHDGYSVIGQGRIDDILAARGNDRREIFEEAVGISRYRQRREDAERRLNQTDENMLRIGDKIAELNLQLEPLREQAETARKYLKLRDEARSLEISLAVRRLDTIAEQSRETDAAIEDVTERLNAANGAIKRVYRDIELSDAERGNLEAESETIRAEIAAVEEKIGEIEQQRAAFEATRKSNEERIEGLREDITRTAERESGLETQINERESRADEIARETVAIEAEIARHTDRLSEMLAQSEASEREYLAILDREREAEYAAAEARAKLSGLVETAQDLSDRETALSRQLITLTDEVAVAETDVTAATERRNAATADVETKKNVIRGFELRVSSRRDKLAGIEESLRRVKRELDSATSRARALEAMEREYEGYAKPVRTVMQERSRGALRGVLGTVGELIKTDEKYALAVETALGAAVGNVVVASESDGEAAINLLKRRDAGRATFLPLTTINGNVLNEKGLDDEAGFCGLAYDLTYAEEQYSGIVASLLGRTVIVETLRDAVGISKKYRARFRLVTLDGQVVNAGGAMTGGSAYSSGVLSRAGELARLRESVVALTEQVKTAESERAELAREFALAESELDSARAALRDAEDVAMRAQNAFAAAERQFTDKTASQSERRDTLATLKERVTRTDAEMVTLRADIETFERVESEQRAALAERSESRQSSSSERDKIQAEIAVCRENLAALAAEQSATRDAIEQLREIRLDILGQSRDRQSSAEELRAKNESLVAEISALAERESALRAEIDGRKTAIGGVTSRKLELEARRTALDKLAREKNNETINLERESSRLEQRRATEKTEESQVVARLWDTYELTRTEAARQAPPLDDESGARRRTEQLRREIASLGNPNIGAIEEYDRISERHEYLTSQRDDVERAARELRDLIAEITSQMRGIFVDGFSEIEESFKLTFNELFGGGEAQLYLEDPDDPLGSGIGISVQPPGKQLRTLTLLSGGERAFVAIALYFAILRVHPAPFVVLDEIEAALDDANVLRFAAYLRRMASGSQMIVISHRRGTMEEADLLIGVTMAERGVSKLLTLSLAEAELVVEK
ncbi:MAG: chromosome segregation protein SMC [Oscillospiraceae bacterium]|nr:chromosome segregation protein SMC [Oscillospiraceae bacterium]